MVRNLVALKKKMFYLGIILLKISKNLKRPHESKKYGDNRHYFIDLCPNYKFCLAVPLMVSFDPTKTIVHHLLYLDLFPPSCQNRPILFTGGGQWFSGIPIIRQTNCLKAGSPKS